MSKRLLACGLLGLSGMLTCVSALANETQKYTYDELGRLIEISTAGTVNDGQAVATGFDPAGNRVSYTVASGNSSSPVISVANAAVIEGSQLSFTVTRLGSSAATNSVAYASANGSAAAPGDFTSAAGSLSFAPGELTKSIAIATIDDTTVESSEAMTLTLSAPTNGASLGVASAAGTINDNDSPSATLTIANASVSEGGILAFTITRSGTTSIAASANYTSASGTATTGTDFSAASGIVSFAAGETSKTISVTTIDDAVVEFAETMSVNLTGPSANTSIAVATGTGTINDNDVAVASLAIGDASVVEGGILSFTVARSGNTTIASNVNYATAGGTASAGSDFNTVSGTLSFLAGETSKSVNVNTTDDAVAEPTEMMTVSLSGPSADTAISTATGTGTLVDNDVVQPASFAVSDANGIEASSLTFLVTRSGDASTSQSVNYATANGTAASNDYTAVSGTLTFAPNETVKSVSVPTNTDTRNEVTETFFLNLTAATGGATISDPQGVGSIDDDGQGGGGCPTCR